MATAADLVMIDARHQGPARCTVCGNDIAVGEGVTARYGNRVLRFKCPGCLARFEADPNRYLDGPQEGCCGRGEAKLPPSGRPSD